MALLASCWFLVDSFIIPHRFRKWFYLLFYLHRIFLLISQFLPWLKNLQNFFLIILLFAFKIATFFSLFIFRFLNNTTKSVSFFPFKQSTKVELFYDAIEQEITHKEEEKTLVSDSMCSSDDNQFDETEEKYCVKDSWLNEYLYSDHYTSTLMIRDCDLEMFDDDDDDDHDAFDAESGVTLLSKCEVSDTVSDTSSVGQEVADVVEDFDGDTRVSQSSCDMELLVGKDRSSSATDVLAGDEPVQCGHESGDVDFFGQKYMERMRFFEVLYHERLYGLNALSKQYMSWSKVERNRVMMSLECEFELIYVAQLCLNWEALHHQYQKAEALKNENIFFDHTVTGKFQEFQVRLERFVEEGQNNSNYYYHMHQRLAIHGHLRVPDVTSYLVEVTNGFGREATKAIQVKKSIEKCIKAFWLYLTRDNKKSLWKYKGILRTHNPPVEDPKDLELLYRVSQALHKKEKMLKDLHGKRNCLLRRGVIRAGEITENEKIRDLVFAMIDVKVVQRLLKMPVITSSQLKWCLQKLNELEFEQGQVLRCTTGHLFPSS